VHGAIGDGEWVACIEDVAEAKYSEMIVELSG